MFLMVVTAVCKRIRSTAALFACVGLFGCAVPCIGDDTLWPAITEPPTNSYVFGKWVWAELFTENVKAARDFYGKTFDWSFKLFSGGRGPSYTVALSDGEPVGGMLQRDHKHQKEPGSRWLAMLSVPDVNAAAKYAAAHGGKVVVPPRMLRGRGEVALLADPEGAPFGVIHSSSGDPPDYLAEDKQWVWIELWAKDPKAMADFYKGLADYQLEPPVQRPDGTFGYFLASSGYTRCSIIPSPAPNIASSWLLYLRVEDVNAATKQAQAAGARVIVPPSAEVRDSTVSLIVDPSGAALGLAELKPDTQ